MNFKSLMNFSAHVWSPDFRNERYVVQAGPAFFLNCLAVIFLEFPSIENESPIALPWAGPMCLLPQGEPVMGGYQAKHSKGHCSCYADLSSCFLHC